MVEVNLYTVEKKQICDSFDCFSCAETNFCPVFYRNNLHKYHVTYLFPTTLQNVAATCIYLSQKITARGSLSNWCIWLPGSSSDFCYLAIMSLALLETPVSVVSGSNMQILHATEYLPYYVNFAGNDTKLAHLWNLEGAKERLCLVKAQLKQEGRFENAIKRCEGVFHMASPVLGQPTDRQDILKPVVDGTLNVLRSCKKESVTKTGGLQIIIFHNQSERKVRSQNTFKRQEFCNENGINLVMVSPSFVVGPSLPPTLCSTASDILGLLQGEREREEAEGRYLCSSTVVDNDELVSIMSARYPTLPIPKRFEQHERPYYQFNTNKIKSLGFTFKSIPEMFDDCITSLVAQGHLSIP
uniref:Tetraketide alpha-pyrone reductase 1 n=1 Tax=Tanacetum cinerariifolium TaxID=118510 RepID=A0A6L2JJT9_TANCI|nr:tetraketide alpha-pyrone reductase 1 [Tanacetum cinerariifolium]